MQFLLYPRNHIAQHANEYFHTTGRDLNLFVIWLRHSKHS